MNKVSVSSADFPADALSLLELTIAQRADHLARFDGCERGKDLQHWLQAERDVLEFSATSETSPAWPAAGR
jgi:hypothetical protein